MSVKLEMFLKSKSKKNRNFEKYQKSLFVQISCKTSNVLQKDSKIEKINLTMIMVAKIEWVPVGKNFLHPFVKNMLFFKIVLMANYRDERPTITFSTNFKRFLNQSQVRLEFVKKNGNFGKCQNSLIFTDFI